jgi:formate--tetrahydrofolate ligase
VAAHSRLDPATHKDWEIAEAALETMKSPLQLAEELGLEPVELLPYGHRVAKVDFLRVLDRLGGRRDGKYIDVTALTPTPLGEGKSTTTMGLVEGLGALGRRVTGAIRQPSSGPTFNIKGSAAGGGLAQCIPLSEFSLGLTGDIDAITNAHNLAMVALTARLQHEFNYSDAFLEKRGLTRLDIDPNNLSIGWVIDFCAQALRQIIMGIGGSMDGFMTSSGFQISVSSELMAILAVARDLPDLRERISRMVVAMDRHGGRVTTADLEVDGAITAIMSRAIYPNLLQTLEGQPVFVHAGPFANIAIGQSSIIADRLALKLSDYHVTESGFGADIGFEKFWNLKCRQSGLVPDCAVIVATVRALKMHGGGPAVRPGKPLDDAYTSNNPGLVEKGVPNLLAHLETVRKSGVPAVVCINDFVTDGPDEHRVIRDALAGEGVRVAVSSHWKEGGTGARELAEAVVEACEEDSRFRFLYELDTSHRDRIETIATEVYGAQDVSFTTEAEQELSRLAGDEPSAQMGTCMVKTQYSLSHDPALKGRPTGWTLPVRNILEFRGAGLVVPVAGDIKLMPGTGSVPAFRHIDVDVKTGRVTGLA